MPLMLIVPPVAGVKSRMACRRLKKSGCILPLAHDHFDILKQCLEILFVLDFL